MLWKYGRVQFFILQLKCTQKVMLFICLQLGIMEKVTSTIIFAAGRKKI